MIPKSCRLSGYDHATEQDHDPEKSPDFSGQSLRLKNAPAKSQRHGRRPARFGRLAAAGATFRRFARPRLRDRV